MSGIVLSSATRQSLLAAQDTATLLATTQNRLATGKKVTSALDNPLNFFTAASLDSRAGDISTLLDSISNGVQTIQSASTGITNIQKLVDSAKSTANQALSTTLSTTGTATTAFGIGTAVVGAITGTAVGSLTGSSALTGTGLALAANDVVTIGGKAITVTTASTGVSDATHIRADDTISNLVSKFNAISGITGTVSFDDTTHKFTVTSNDATGATQVAVGTDAVTKLGFTSAQASTNAQAKGTLTSNTAVSLVVNGTTITGTIPAGSTASTASTYLNGLSGVPSGTFGFDAAGKITVSSSANVQITDSTTKTALGLSGSSGVQASELTVVGADTRANLAAQYNSLLVQIDQLAGDASFNGVNLLNSSAASNKLHLSFNDKDTSNLDVLGVNAKSSGLGLTAIDVTAGGTGNFVGNTDITSTVSKLTAATATLRGYASTFGSNLTVVQNRQDFSKNLINVLQTGSANLTNADLNEEAANSQALSTRQSLAISALSLANTAQQNVLQLLR